MRIALEDLTYQYGVDVFFYGAQQHNLHVLPGVRIYTYVPCQSLRHASLCTATGNAAGALVRVCSPLPTRRVLVSQNPENTQSR